jgi:hypothetical protein
MYLAIINGDITFKTPEIHEILESDVKISDEIYNRFFELQSQGKQFKIKDMNGTTFEEIFVEVIPDAIPQPKSELEILKETVDILVLSSLGVL